MPDELETLATELDNGGQGQGRQDGRDVSDRQDGTPVEVPAGEGDGRDEGAEDGPDTVVDEPRRASRRDARIETLLERSNNEKARADRLEATLEEIRRSQQTQQRRESPEEEAARLALMNPDERTDYRLNKALRQIDESNRQTAFLAQEAADKAGFEAKVSMDPLYAKLAPAVEKTLQDLRSKGQNVPRQVLFELEVGRAALASRGKAKGQKERGAANVRSQTSPPLNGKGDTSGQRRRGGDTPAKRLEDVQI